MMTRDERIARVRARYPRAFDAWTSQDDARLDELTMTGATLDELSRELGRPERAVRWRAERRQKERAAAYARLRGELHAGGYAVEPAPDYRAAFVQQAQRETTAAKKVD